MRTAEVIVGIDGSPQSRLALRWAAAEAVRRDAPLHVVHAYHATWPDAAYSPERAEQAADAAGHNVVADAVEDVRRNTPNVSVTGTAVLSGAAKALLDAARPGDLVVVGSRGRSEFVTLLAGSTCQQVATHAKASVVVVRGRPGPDGPVVVGHDGSAGAQAVIETAFEAAAARGCGLTVMRTFRPSMPAWPADAPPPKVFNAATTQAALTAELTRIVQPLVEKYPGVSVQVCVRGGDPAQALVDVSHLAQLVVVGSRGHGGFAGLLLGSVGLQLLHHAHCPVLLARR